MRGDPSSGASGVKLLLWRIPRPAAVAICLALYVTAIACVVVALNGSENNRWLWFTGFVLGIGAGFCNSAVIRSDRGPS